MDGDRLVYRDENGLTRRTALGAVLGTPFALAVQPVQAQTMIVTPTDGLTAGVVAVKTKDGKEMDAYRAMPASGTGFGTILVVQEIFGVHAHNAPMCPRCGRARPKTPDRKSTPLHSSHSPISHCVLCLSSEAYPTSQ